MLARLVGACTNVALATLCECAVDTFDESAPSLYVYAWDLRAIVLYNGTASVQILLGAHVFTADEVKALRAHVSRACR
jgi:hypothetical protein